jgi:hypothetical protein
MFHKTHGLVERRPGCLQIRILIVSRRPLFLPGIHPMRPPGRGLNTMSFISL